MTNDTRTPNDRKHDTRETGETPRPQSDRDTAHDDPSHRGGGAGPSPDHSEREMGSDQDIDTAGQIPGNKATEGV